jgi:hypothetical protein
MRSDFGFRYDAFRARRAAFSRALEAVLRDLQLTDIVAGQSSNVHHGTIGKWRRAETFPNKDSFYKLLLFLREFAKEKGKKVIDLEEIYLAASAPLWERLFAERDEAPETIDEKAVEQIPAAFRFGVKENKIDALPENLETLDPTVSLDLYEELVAKTRVLLERLKRSNVDPHVNFAVERLLQSLGANYGDVRPGLVLSRLRSIESIVAGYDSEEGRAALFPDAVAMLSDVHLSGQDFLATFPNVRRIERERITIGLEKDPAVIAKALDETVAIRNAAAHSDIVAPGAVNALGENEPDIRQAQSVEVKADLVADRLLIHRNFVGQALRAITRKSGGVWEVIGPDFITGSKVAARMLPPLAVIGLLTAIAGPIAGLAGLLRGDLFKPVRGAVTSVQKTARRTEKKK